MAEVVIAEFRRTIFSEKRDVRAFAAGMTLAEIAAAFDRPAEFAACGAIFLKRDETDPGEEIAREFWHRVRPKPAGAIFITCVPQNGEGGKSIVGLAAAIALVALTAWVGGGGLAFLSPHLAAGTVGVKIAQAAITVAGAAAISALTKPPVGEQGGGSDNLGYAGISQNILSVNQQLPAVLGAMRISPPQIMRPFTEIDGTDQYVTGVVGLCGPVDINAIKVNETAIEDLPDGTFDYEIREGYPDDEQLELVRLCGFEETINLEMSKHRLDKDNTTLIAPHTGSYPQPHILRTARRPDSFRVMLGFAQGLSKFDNGVPVLLPLRLEMRALGDSTWRKLPELHLEAVVRSPFRQEIVFHFGGDEVALRAESAGVSSLWKRLYARNAEWQADAYFTGSANVLDFNTRHVYAAGDRVLVYCDPASFAAEKYDIRIVRGFVQSAGAQHSDTVYTGGLFTYRTDTSGVFTIPRQSDFAGAVTIESYTTFRNEYPFHHGVAMLAFRAKNLRINSINFDATPIVPVWDGVDWSTEEPSSNPAALARWVRCGPLNARPVDPALAQGLEEWFEYCEDEGLSCNALISEGSVERAANLAANCGDALLRESDRWGPVIDRDRSAEPAKHGFSPHNMTSPLVMKKSFTRIADGIYPTFFDAQRDYATRTLDHGIFADGADVSAGALMEGASYDGLVFEALVVRRARLDLRRSRHRAVQYSWGCHQEQLVAVNGELTALAHDILSETYAIGRVKSFAAAGGNLKTVTLNTRIDDIPVSSDNGFFSVEDVFQLSDIFTLAGPKLGMQIRLDDASVITIPVASVSDATLTVEGTFPLPALLRRTALVHVGWRERVSRRVIITNIVNRGDYHAQIEGVDEAPQIFAGL